MAKTLAGRLPLSKMPDIGLNKIIVGQGEGNQPIEEDKATGNGGVDTSGTPIANDIARFTDADTIEGRSYSEFKADLDLEIGTDMLAQQTIGIADNNLLEVDHVSPADNDYAKFTANGLEGRSYSEVRTDINVADGADVTGSTAPQAHAASHQNTGGDEIDVVGLSGLLADDQHVLDVEVVAAAKTVKLDDFTTPDNNTDLDASTARHGLFAKLLWDKLNGIEASAKDDLTGAEIVTLLEALGGGSQLSHDQLDDVSTSDHHTKYSDANARSAAVSDTAYAASWNGVTSIAPSKNAVYDKIETLAGNGGVTFTELAGGQNRVVSSTSTWEDWDLSGIVPAGAVSVLVAIGIGTSPYIIGARKNGTALDRKAPGPDIAFDSWSSWGITFLTECDASRIIDIYSQSTSNKFNILGYWS